MATYFLCKMNTLNKQNSLHLYPRRIHMLLELNIFAIEYNFKHHLLKTQYPSQTTQKILSVTWMRKQAGFFGGVLVVLLVVGNCYSQWLDFKMCQNSGAIMHPVMPMWSIEYLTSYIRSIHFHALFDLLALLRRYLE